jgi:pyruvate-formate lyase
VRAKEREGVIPIGNPENHRDLVVKVASYSAYFLELEKKVQDEIMALRGLSI